MNIWVHRLGHLLVVSVALLSGCLSKPTESLVASPTLQEEYVIYGALIESLYGTEGDPLFVIQDQTQVYPPPDQSPDLAMAYIQEQLGTAIETTTLEDYYAKNQHSQLLGQAPIPNVRYVWVSQAEIARLLKRDNGWDRFYAKYSDAQGILSLSRVGLNAAQNQALVYIGNQGDASSGRGHYVLLNKSSDSWEIQAIALAWIS